MTTSAQQDQTNISSSSTPETLIFLKGIEYLSLAAFVGAFILTRIIPDNQPIFIWGTIFLSVFIFLFLTNQKIFQKYKDAATQLDIERKAELHLLGSNNSSSNLAREKALRYSQELIDDYKSTRETSRNIYYIFQLATVILSGVTPILVLVDKLEAGQTWLKWLPVICPAVASIVASIVTSFPFQENWISANTAVELLEAEQEKFVLGVTPAYRSYDQTDEAQRQQKSQQAVENFILQVNNIHLKLVQKSSDTQFKEEKSDQPQSSESNQGQS